MHYTQSNPYMTGAVIGAVIKIVIILLLAAWRNRSVLTWCIASIFVPGFILIPTLLLAGYNPRAEVRSCEEFRCWLKRFRVSEDAACEKFSIGNGYDRDYYSKEAFEAYGERVLSRSSLLELKGERRCVAKNGTAEIKRYVLPIYDRVIAKKRDERSIVKKLRKAQPSASANEKPITVKAEAALSSMSIEPAAEITPTVIKDAPPTAEEEATPTVSQEAPPTAEEEVPSKRRNKPAVIAAASVLAVGMLSAGISIGVVLGKDSVKKNGAEYRELAEKYTALEEDYEILNAKYKRYYNGFEDLLEMLEKIDELCDNYSGEGLHYRIKLLLDGVVS